MDAMGKGITLYLKEGVAEDDQIRAVWDSASLSGRPQELFRRLLLMGIRAAHERGELPHAASEVIDPLVVLPLNIKGGMKLPGIPSGWRIGDPPLVEHRNKPRGKNAARYSTQVTAPVERKEPQEPLPYSPPGKLGRLMG